MDGLEKFVTWKTSEGKSITVGDRTLTLQSQALRVQWPGGGFVWNRPTGVRASEGDGTEFFAITDPTRTVVWALWAVATLALATATMGGIRQLFVRLFVR